MDYRLIEDNDQYVWVTDGDHIFKIDSWEEHLVKVKNNPEKDDLDDDEYGILYIPSWFVIKNPNDTIRTLSINSIGPNVYSGQRCRKLIIENGINQISARAFACARFRDVVWPRTCTVIPDWCFHYSRVNNIEGIDCVERIGNHAFKNTYLVDFKLPEGVKSIGNFAFSECWGLENIEIPDTVERIGEGAFSKSKLKRLTWPSSCYAIKKGTFSDCRNLREVTNIQGVTSIGANAFYRCEALSSISWPRLCKKVPMRCFYRCDLLSELSLPDGVETIEKKAFEKTSIKRFVWPSNCRQIPEACFKGSSLSEIENISHVENIGMQAFQKTKLSSFEWPPGVRKIPTECFRNTPLKSLTNLEKVTSIGRLAFTGSRIKELDLSHTAIASISTSAFYNSKLTKESVIPPYYVTAADFDKAFAY